MKGHVLLPCVPRHQASNAFLREHKPTHETEGELGTWSLDSRCQKGSTDLRIDGLVEFKDGMRTLPFLAVPSTPHSWAQKLERYSNKSTYDDSINPQEFAPSWRCYNAEDITRRRRVSANTELSFVHEELNIDSDLPISVQSWPSNASCNDGVWNRHLKAARLPRSSYEHSICFKRSFSYR